MARERLETHSVEFEREVSQRLELANRLALVAGQNALERQMGELGVEQKPEGPGDIVTITDKENQKIIADGWAQLFPNDSFRGEEGDQTHTQDSPEGFTIIVDPVDGTVPYRGLAREYGVSIGINYEGRIVAGVVNFPGRGMLFSAQEGKGAFSNDQQVHTRTVKNLADVVIGYNYTYLRNQTIVDEYLTDFFKALFKGEKFSAQYVSVPLCVTWAMCQVAEGRGEPIYLCTNLSPYDLGAAPLIIREAGGVHSKIDWTKPRQAFLCAANQELYDQMINTLGPEFVSKLNLQPNIP